jgi:putative ABC transport system permease protein
MRRLYFAGEDPVGKRVTVNYLNSPLPLEVVGVVRDIKQESLAEPTKAQIYVSYIQVPWFSTSLVVRAKGDTGAVLASVERAVREGDPAQTATGAKTMEQALYDSAAPPRFYSLLLGTFAALALLLASIGIYGVLSYAVAQRTQEIGIRMALGARGGDVLRMVIGQGMTLTLLGVGVGLPGALLLTRVMRGLLFGVSATDPLTFAGVALVLALAALVACLIPARRATKVDPMVALRYE